MKSSINIGVGVIIVDDDLVLMGKRINSHGHETWVFPGGHLELSETPQKCAIREVMEETGLIIDHVKSGPFTYDFFELENKYYITLFMIAEYLEGLPEVKEKNKCLEWRWVKWDKLPVPLFAPVRSLLNAGYSLEMLKNFSGKHFKNAKIANLIDG